MLGNKKNEKFMKQTLYGYLWKKNIMKLIKEYLAKVISHIVTLKQTTLNNICHLCKLIWLFSIQFLPVLSVCLQWHNLTWTYVMQAKVKQGH